MDSFDHLATAARAYQAQLPSRRVFPSPGAIAALSTLPASLPETGLPLEHILALLANTVAPATVLTTSGRYFGFVTGGSLPAALAANQLAAVWDQNAALRIMSPAAVELESTALRWIADFLHLPPTSLGAFVSGATMANFTAMAAARHALLAAQGHDVESLGLFAAPPFPVLVGEQAHVSVFKALAMLGLGRDRVIRVPSDSQGRMRPDAFPSLSQPALVCLQAGNVNTGALDSPELIPLAKQSNSWVHVDGAFGLWSPNANYAAADSWATDSHKWLNVPYDSGIVFVRDPQALSGAMTLTASYLDPGAEIEPMQRAPESSRRARGIDTWAALLSLGRTGLSEMIERCCRHARHFASVLALHNVEILNEVSLNQVLAALPSDQQTLAWLQAVQAEGECWLGSTIWSGRRALRISVSSWATTDQDVERSLASLIRHLPAK